jgi:serine/threonine protein kinase
MYPQVFGKYVLERELARGGMARVVLATLRGAGGFEKRLVVKQIRDELASDDEFVRRFVEEAKTTVALAHPNIVPVYELGVELGTYFLAMEYVAGASLAELLRAGGGKPLSPEEGAYIGVEVCRALDYAHRRMNVVHRDVTPRNVMVDEEGQVKVIDFGISAPVATTPSGHGVFGSPGHMPPEQMKGKEITAAADVFAVAVLLMELWSGKAPFRRRTHEAVEEAMRAPHPSASDADIRLLPLDPVIASAMSLEPSERPQQADDLARALRRFLAGIDLGDVARQLGDRVCRVREHPPPPSAEQGPALQRPPSRPTAMQVGTKTFAVRSEVAAVESSSAGPSTRKLATSEPPPAQAKAETLEGVDAIERRPAQSKRGFAWRALVAAGAIGVVAFLIGRGAASVSTQTPAPTVMATATESATAIERATATATAAATAAAATGTAAAGAMGTSTSSTNPTDRAQLVLLGDGTYVTVDGTSRGGAPARVALEPGSHSVLFTFPATGESKGATVTLRAGEHATMRADFTGAQPTIRLQR